MRKPLVASCSTSKMSKIADCIRGRTCAAQAKSTKLRTVSEVEPVNISLTLVKLSVMSPYLHPLFEPAFIAIPSFGSVCKVRKLLLNLNMKCWDSPFNVQGSRVIIVVGQIGAVKIYLAALAPEALRKNERQHETKFISKIGVKTNLAPSYLIL